MIPRRLVLRNFLSYRECTLDLTGVQMAVLSGRNGDGKSALLDAMTWALWGKARGRLEDDRIYMNAPEMRVEFEFEAGGDRYLVVRRRTRGRASGSLDFYQLTERGRTTLTGGTARETQEAIAARLHLDYDTFLNSAFIAQGRANEFTRKNASDRKEVFRRILGLERYEALADAAGTRRKEAEVRFKELERQAAAARSEVEQLPAVEDAIAAVRTDLADAEARLAPLEAELAELHIAQRDYERLCAEVQQEEARLAQLWRQRDALHHRLEGARTEVAALELRLARRAEIETRHRELLAAREEEGTHEERRRAAATAEEQHRTAQQRLERARTLLEAEAADVARRLREAEDGARQTEALSQEGEQLAAERAALAGFEERAKAVLARAHEASLRAQAARQAADAALARAKEVKARKTQLEGAGARCPTCGKPMSPAEAGRAIAECTAEQQALRGTYEAALGAESAAKAEETAAREEHERLAAEQRTREATLLAREREFAGLAATARAAAERLPALRHRQAELERTLAAGDFDVDAAQALAEAQATLARIAYDPAAHDALRERIRALANAEHEFRELSIAATRHDALLDAIRRDEAALATLAQEAEVVEAAVRRARLAVTGADDVSPRLGHIATLVAELRAQQTALARREGQLEHQRESLQRLAAQMEQARDELRALAEERDLYDELHRAFGKDGVQAMLIDQSLPRVERTANEMLERMTGGRIAVALRTQRATRAGAKETLDIDICDELGTRDYEMYSGGEAFRVDFALRIALARLLAERSGAEMPTLIIDEGFGTQDAEGIDRLTEAIFAIRDEFRLVLVVTHLEEMKSRFPARIEVRKEPGRGSLARVVFA